MSARIVLLVAGALLAGPLGAELREPRLDREEALRQLVPGDYHLIGKRLDRDDAFVGQVRIEAGAGRRLRVIRQVDGQRLEAVGAIEPVLRGEAQVLRIRFQDQGVDHEQTCLVSADLDNLARISCYLYQPGVHTDSPGMEVLFPVRQPW